MSNTLFTHAALLFGSTASAQTAPPIAPTGEAEAARVISLVSSIPLAVDLAHDALAANAFAPRVLVDYTSLWGGTPHTLTPAQLLQAWRRFALGFDATWHELSDVQARVHGPNAHATARVDSRHWLGAAVWRPIGRCEWALEKRAGRWKVTCMTFKLTQEIGDRGLAKNALERGQRLALAHEDLQIV